MPSVTSPPGLSPPPAPAHGDRRLPWRSARFAALDFETTGLDYARDAVVSFGVVPVERGRVHMAGAMRQLTRPDVPPSPRSQTIHELRPKDLDDAPPLEEAGARLADALAHRFLLVWFADVEVHFLGRIFDGGTRRWRRRVIDVRTLAIAADDAGASARRAPGYALSATAQRYGVPVDDPHDALDDALVTAQLFLVLAPRVAGESATVRRLLRAGRPG